MTFEEYYKELEDFYNEIKTFLEGIEKNNISEYSSKLDLLKANIKEKIDFIYSEIENVEENISINKETIDLNHFINLSNLKDKIILQYNKLNFILENIFSFEINESKTLIENSFKEAENLKLSLEEAKQKQAQLQKESNETEEKLKEIEHKTNNNILTFIGIFSSIITIITASISTANSWLNNSNGSFVLALFAPATIITVTILVLFLLIKYIISDKSPKKRYIITSSIICGILFIITIILTICINPKEKVEPCEESYIIIPIKEANEESNKIIYIYNGVEFTIEFNYDLLHNDGLHYCTKHDKFE